MSIQEQIKKIKEKIADIDSQRDPLQEELNNLRKQVSVEIDNRVSLCHKLGAGEHNFKTSDLHYAAFKRCDCGHGLAYPEGIGMHGSWHCSAILTGIADPEKMHNSGFPFAMYEIKSEKQPSANGATTRPKS